MQSPEKTIFCVIGINEVEQVKNQIETIVCSARTTMCERERGKCIAEYWKCSIDINDSQVDTLIEVEMLHVIHKFDVFL